MVSKTESIRRLYLPASAASLHTSSYSTSADSITLHSKINIREGFSTLCCVSNAFLVHEFPPINLDGPHEFRNSDGYMGLNRESNSRLLLLLEHHVPIDDYPIGNFQPKLISPFEEQGMREIGRARVFN